MRWRIYEMSFAPPETRAHIWARLFEIPSVVVGDVTLSPLWHLSRDPLVLLTGIYASARLAHRLWLAGSPEAFDWRRTVAAAVCRLGAVIRERDCSEAERFDLLERARVALAWACYGDPWAEGLAARCPW